MDLIHDDIINAKLEKKKKKKGVIGEVLCVELQANKGRFQKEKEKKVGELTIYWRGLEEMCFFFFKLKLLFFSSNMKKNLSQKEQIFFQKNKLLSSGRLVYCDVLQNRFFFFFFPFVPF